MERFVRKYDKESMKMMMMKHEETFRQQVHELHRLYRLQKLLMMDMENKQRLVSERKNGAADSCVRSNSGERRGRRQQRRRRRRVLNLELPADEYIEEAEEEAVGSDIELELRIGRGPWSGKGEEEEDAALTSSDSGASTLSSSSSESGGGSLRLQQGGGDVGVGCENAEKKQFEVLPAPWHLQCLSLKMV